MNQTSLFETDPPIPKRPPCRYTPEFIADFRELLKKHEVDFVAFDDDGKERMRFSSQQMVNGKYPVFIVDVEQFTIDLYSKKK